MAKRGLYQRLRSNAQVRSALFCLGGLLMIVAVLIGPLPGPGFIILFPVGLMLALQNSAWEGTTLGTVSFSYYNQSQDQSLSLTLGDDFTGTLYLQLYGTYGTLAYKLSIFSANTGSSTDTPQVTVPETTPVPLPAAGVLMMAGLGAFGALRGLRKRAPRA